MNPERAEEAEETGEPVCMLELVCPECGRVTTDEDAPGCEACRQS